ncbi:MAG: hypothetical protein AB1546_13220, partial [bacterium]
MQIRIFSRMSRNFSVVSLVVLLFVLSNAAWTSSYESELLPPMDNGELDAAGRPFDYFAFPTTVVGVKDGKYGAEITHEGAIFTGSAELGFFVGADMIPVNQRVKTLEDGYLPIVHAQFSFDGLNYDINYFSDTADGAQGGILLYFARATITNPDAEVRKGYFWAAQRFQGPHHRVQAHMQRDLIAFQPVWNYAMTEDLALRAGRIIYAYTTAPTARFIQPGVPYTNLGEKIKLQKHYQQDWVNIVQYELDMQPGRSTTIDFIMPFKPASQKYADRLRKVNVSERLDSVRNFWRSELASGTTIEVPEKKVNDTYRANLAYMMLARAKEGEDYVQKVNKFQYDWFWIRDASFMLLALDQFGYHTDAERGALYFLKHQNEAGNFESQRGQLDGFGQTLWVFGEHYELTQDNTFLRAVYPGVRRAMQWLAAVREKHKHELKDEDAPGYGLMPISNPGDNELVDGHVIGHDLWGLTGVKNAIRMARALGEEEDARQFEAEYEDYHKYLMKNLDLTAVRTGGYISPAVEPGG